MSLAVRRGDNGRRHGVGLGDEPVVVDVPACHTFRRSALRLQPLALADNLAQLLRTLAPPDAVARWSVTTPRD